MFSWKILVAGFFMFICLLLAMPSIQAAVAVGEDISSYTSNTSHWVGFTETVNFAPIALLFFAVVIPIAAWMKARRSGE